MKRKKAISRASNGQMFEDVGNNVRVLKSKRNDIKYDLSICLITKNEEKYIERCLQALVPLKEEISCEIIVTDTGSTDKTVEISQKYADKVLHFEWINDFSAARNTGVEACSGAWFMFVDADEIFDHSVIEIAKFIKSKDRDCYDGASFIQRSYAYEDNLTKYSDFNVSRLFNFVYKKRFFINKIHEVISNTGEIYPLNAIADHFGYLIEIMQQKKDRNFLLMQQEHEQQPKDIRTIKHLMGSVELEEQLVFLQKAIDIKNELIKKPLTNKENIDYFPLTYVLVASSYSINEQIIELEKLADNFFEDDYFKVKKIKSCMPKCEMYYILAFTFIKNKNYQKALDNLKQYRELYNYIGDNPDTTYINMQPYMCDNVVAYQNAFLQELTCYEKLDDIENLIKVLDQEKINDHTNDLNLAGYIYYLIKYNRVSTATEYIDKLKKEIDIYNYKNSSLFFGLKLLALQDVRDFLENCSLDAILAFINQYFNNAYVYKLNALYEVLSNKNDYYCLKEMCVYLKLMEKYIVLQSKTILEQDECTDEDLVIKDIELEKEKLNKIFEIYVKNMYLYVRTIYNSELLDNKQFDVLLGEEIFCYIVYPALEQKSNNSLEYIKTLKVGLNYCKEFKNVITNVLFCIEKENANLVNDTPVVNTEFESLSEKIKLTIIDAIKANELDKAKIIIEEYKKINPSDPDIIKLLNIIGS